MARWWNGGWSQHGSDVVLCSQEIDRMVAAPRIRHLLPPAIAILLSLAILLLNKDGLSLLAEPMVYEDEFVSFSYPKDARVSLEKAHASQSSKAPDV